MQNQTPTDISIQLLADVPHLIKAVGELRWREWGDQNDPASVHRWIKVSEEEAGYDRLPVTWVAVDAQGQAVGAMGLMEFDIEEARDRSPWVVGAVVTPHRRSTGVGSQLMAALEAFAHLNGYSKLWVATGGRALRFYQKCGWTLHEIIERPAGENATILSKSI